MARCAADPGLRIPDRAAGKADQCGGGEARKVTTTGAATGFLPWADVEQQPRRGNSTASAAAHDAQQPTYRQGHRQQKQRLRKGEGEPAIMRCAPP